VQAALDAATAANTALKQNYATSQANLKVLAGTGDIGTGLGANALASVQRDATQALGVGTGVQGAPGAALSPSLIAPDGSIMVAPGQPIIVVAQQNLIPGSVETQHATARGVATALEGVGYVPTRRESVA
jgi:hypothetical protein